WSRVHMAYALLRQGDFVQARETFKISLQQFEKAGYMNGLICSIEGLASWYANQGQLERATQLFTWADTMREKMDDRRTPVEQNSVEKDLAIIHSKLNGEGFAKCSAEGRVMTMEQA